MRALKLKARIGPEHRIELIVPPDLPEGEVEIIVLAPDTPESAEPQSLRLFFEELDRSPRKRMTKEEIDRYIADERASWD